MPAATMTGLRGKVYEKLSQKAVWEQSHNIFEQLDEDGSGFLDVAELQQGMERFGAKLSEKQVREMCAKIGGGDEGLNRQQLMTFLTMLLGVKIKAPPGMGGLRGAVYAQASQKAVWEQSHNILVQLDEDGSGFLDVAELQQGMERFGAKLSEKQVREMCAKIGGGDEGLNRQQLMTFLTMLLGIKDLATPKAGCEFRGTTVDAALRCSLC
jgi:Ca2+-binding EF-hand superfamily protein